MRFCTYLVAPGIDQARLARLFANGEHRENPAFGRVLGTVGPWRAEEMTSVTLGRLLLPSVQLADGHTYYRPGPAVAQIDRERHILSLDLITAFPERDEELNKVNLGPVWVQSHHEDNDGDEKSTRLGPVPYDKSAYQATAGVVDVPYSPDVEPFLDKGQLRLVGDDRSGTVLLSETDLMVETDGRAFYLQEGETQQVHLRAAEKGRTPQLEVTVRLEQYVTTNIKGMVLASLDTQVVEIPDQIDVGPEGGADLSVKAKRPGVCVIRFVPGTTRAFDPTTDFFTNVRVLPADDYDDLPDEQLTFDLLEQEILRYYYVLYPAMTDIIDLGDESEMRRSAGRIASQISKDNWSEYGYMPRTRELSDGKRKLLTRWCRLQTAGSSPTD